jgi:PAS domain S-box-containing protein
MCDSTGAITYCNQRLYDLLGYPADGRQLDCHQIHFEDDRPELESRFDRRRRGISESYDKRLRRKDDSAVWVSSSASPVYNDCGQFAGSLCMFSDVTERKRLEEQLLQSQKMQAIGQLAGGIAHDFNNLLTVILGYSAVLERRLSDDPLLKNVIEVRKAGERAAQLTQQLLAFSRKQVLRPRVISVNQLVRGTEVLLRRLIGEHIGLTVDLDPDVGNIKADPGQIEQVLMNLAINARDAMTKGGRLLVETRRHRLSPEAAALRSLQPGAHAELTVTDTGCGMDEQTKRRIFEPFFTTKDLGIGTGLGLSTVQGIVNQSGGSISVYSELGVGTTFKIYLPLVDDLSAESDSPVLQTAAPAGETILVVEDDASIRRLAVEVLREHGYQVFEAGCAEEAITTCEAGPAADLLLTDVVMPGMNGHELAGVLMASHPALKVLYMSGYTEKGIVQQGVVDPSLNFLQKPFRPDELLWKVGEVLTRRPGPAKVLIVDDDTQVRSFVATLLEVEGFEVSQAANGRQAQERCRAGDIDLVITDLVMPEQEGLETIHAIRRNWPQLPVIAISGAFGGAYLDLAKKLGAQAIIRKPFQADEVLAEVQRLTKRSSA